MNAYILIFGLLVYLTFLILIIIGAAFISNVLLNTDTTCVGIDTTVKLNIAKMTIIIFWIIFVPMCLAPIIILFKS